MTEKRFELIMSGNEVAQYEIIDHSQEILTIYNDLGNVYFSSAMKICELLNSLADENEQLKVANGEMEDYLARLEEENKQLKQFIRQLQNNCGEIVLLNGSGYTKKYIEELLE